MTFGLLPSRRHVTWRDSVSVWVHCLGSKWEWVGILQQSFSVCCALLTSHKNGETVVYGYNPRSVLGSFGVVLMSCKVYFHVVRSALQNSVGLLRQCSSGPSLRGRRLGSFRRERNSRAAAREEGGEETTTLPRTGMFVWTANGRDTLIGGFESTRIPHITGRPPSVSGGRCWLKSEQRSFVIYRRNTYEQYGGYNLFQNAEFKANFSITVWGKC